MPKENVSTLCCYFLQCDLCLNIYLGSGVVSGEYCKTTSGYTDREEGKASSKYVQTTPEMPQTAEISWTWNLITIYTFFFSSSFSLSLPESLVSLLNKKYFKSIFIKYVVACLRNNKILLVFFRRQSKLKCGKIPYLQVSVSRSACFLWDLKNLGSTSRGPCRGPLLDFL